MKSSLIFCCFVLLCQLITPMSTVSAAKKDKKCKILYQVYMACSMEAEQTRITNFLDLPQRLRTPVIKKTCKHAGDPVFRELDKYSKLAEFSTMLEQLCYKSCATSFVGEKMIPYEDYDCSNPIFHNFSNPDLKGDEHCVFEYHAYNRFYNIGVQYYDDDYCESVQSKYFSFDFDDETVKHSMITAAKKACMEGSNFRKRPSFDVYKDTCTTIR